jgi:hypothetical protein
LFYLATMSVAQTKDIASNYRMFKELKGYGRKGCRPNFRYHPGLRFQLLTATRMKMAVFWNVASSSRLEIDRRFRGAYCLNNQGDCSKHF